MGDLGEFTVANIAMEEDKREEKKGTVDRTKLEADIKANEALAKEVGVFPLQGWQASSRFCPSPWQNHMCTSRFTTLYHLNYGCL